MTRPRGEAGAPSLGPYQITDQEFELLRSLVQRETGIQLPESKRALLVGRLARRLRELKLESYSAYYRRIARDGDEAERVRMIDLIATNETHFFREPRQFELLEQRLIPAWKKAAEAGRRPRALRVWSAACSTGEEPFSVAMLLASELGAWQIEIVASDLSTRVLEQARAATWPIEKAREIPDRFLKPYMLRGIGSRQGTMRAVAEIRSLVRFAQVNLHREPLAVDGLFDIILCRNVLIYFSAEGRSRVIAGLLAHLDPRGYLFLGHAEALSGAESGLRSCGSSVYQRAEASREGGR